MSINDFRISPFLLRELYTESLVENEPPFASGALKVSGPANIRHLGKNEKNILVIVQEKSHPLIGDTELSFLLNILGACKISLSDVALVNVEEANGVNNVILNEQFQPQIIVLFGTAPQHLGFPVQIPDYQIQKHAKQKYLCAPSLQQLSTDTDSKKLLWKALQSLFQLNEQ